MDEDLLNLENKHRKEKKELQAQIQALKKTAKNDKSKKKELTAEIARLEFELENRHKQELEVTQKESYISSPEDEEPQNESEIKVKVSKAQKRRQKKLQQEKQREEEIKLQEKENLHGPRNLEIETISSRLKKKKLKIFPIPSDGDCLYKAIAHQLLILRQISLSVDNLRNKVAVYIKENKDDFMPFMSTDAGDMMSEEQFEEYCHKISDSKDWGGQLEIRALSNILECPISVIQATGPDSIEQGSEFQGTSLVITYHRHMYKLGEHYNSTEPLVSDNEDN